MTAYALDALLALFLLSTLTSTVVVLAAIALAGHRNGVERVRRGTTWDCGCLSRIDVADGLGCAHRGGRR